MFTREQAEAITDRIKVNIQEQGELIEEAYVGEADAALGYESWSEYVSAEFPSRPRFNRKERKITVKSLTEAGMSQPVIASTLGVSDRTVRNDLVEDDLDAEKFPHEDQDRGDVFDLAWNGTDSTLIKDQIQAAVGRDADNTFPRVKTGEQLTVDEMLTENTCHASVARDIDSLKSIVKDLELYNNKFAKYVKEDIPDKEIKGINALLKRELRTVARLKEWMEDS